MEPKAHGIWALLTDRLVRGRLLSLYLPAQLSPLGALFMQIFRAEMAHSGFVGLRNPIGWIQPNAHGGFFITNSTGSWGKVFW